MREINEEDWPIISDDFEPLLSEGIALCHEIISLLNGVSARIKSEFTGP